MGLIFNGNGDVIKAVDGSLTVEGLDLDSSSTNINAGIVTGTSANFTGAVSVGGVLTYEDVKNVDSVGIVTARDHINIVTDNKKLQVGAGQDLTLHHDGTHSYITNTTGDLRIVDTTGMLLRSNSLDLRNGAGDENYITCAANGAVSLYYDNSKKFETTSSGVTVTGDVILGDNNALRLGPGPSGNTQDLKIYHDGNNSYIDDTGTGRIRIRGNDAVHIRSLTEDEELAVFNRNGSVDLYHNASKKLETTSTGVNITGVTVDDGATHDGDVSFAGANWSAMWDKSKSALILNDNAQLNFGTDEDGDIYHDNSQMIINNATGILRIRSSEVRLCNTSNSTYFTGISGGAAKLYHNDSVKLETTSSGVTVTGDMNISDGTGQSHYQITQTNGNTVKFGIVSGSDIELSGASNNSMYFKTNNTERLRITSGGQLFVGGNTGYNESSALISIATDSSAGANMLSDSSAIYNHNNPAFIHVQNRYNTGTGQEAGIIFHSRSSYNGSWAIYSKRTATNFLADLVFRNRTASATSAERLRIDSSGNMGLGTGSGIDRQFHIQGTHPIIKLEDTGGGYSEISANTAVLSLRADGGNSQSSSYINFEVDGTERVRIKDDGTLYTVNKLGCTTSAPFSKLQVGNHTFTGGHGMYANDRVGMSNHGSLTGLMLASTYNDSNHPEYGVVFVQGPSTSSYNVWSISPDGPAKGNSLNLHYGAQNTNIHSPGNRKFQFTGGGCLLKPLQPRAAILINSQTTISNAKVTNWASPLINVGSFWDTTNKRFVAPIAGVYMFGGNFRIGAPGHIRIVKFNLQLYTSGGTHYGTYGSGVGGSHNYDDSSSGYDHPYVSFTNMIELAAGAYVELHLSEVATQNTSYIQTNNHQSGMWGYLLM